MPDVYQHPSEHPGLEPGAAHVWQARLDPAPDKLSELAAALASDERDRAARFHFDRDRDRYIAARGTLRRLLARYTGVAPAELAFQYGPQGKPALVVPSAAKMLEFNVAHSGDLALLAFARERSIGVDVEFLRDVPDALAIARGHFTLAETRLLEAAKGSGRRDAFFRLWTRKESVIKAIGTGLSMPLTEFDVGSAAAANAWQLVRVPSRPGATWAVRDLAPADGYRGAVTVEGPPGDLLLFST